MDNRTRISFVVAAAAAMLISSSLSACTGAQAGAFAASRRNAAFARSKATSVQTGTASWYHDSHFAGTPARGNELTAAHRGLPLNTYVRVTNLTNNRSAVVRINDRGPYVKNRILDLNPAAARELAMVSAGTAPVRIEVLAFPPVAERL